MKLPRLVAVSLLVFSSFAATGVTPAKTELETMYDKAFREFDANHYDEALKALDAIDARQPDLAESQNLRGVVLIRKREYDKAQAALRKALEIEPKFWNAQFNLAEIPFLKRDWAEARNRFEALVAGNSSEMKGETSLLIQYKILLTFVLEGKESMVDWIVNKFEGEKDSPALYFSNAAIALQHNNQKEAQEWMDAADKHYPAALNKLFAESFYEVGWLQKPEGETRAAIEITSTAERAQRMKGDAQANFERAERAFQQRDFAGALTFLNLADEGAPDRAESINLRGEIYMENGKLDAAEDAFLAATKADPKFREAQYNFAQIPFKKKGYAKSRERLETLYAQTPGGEKNQAAQLIKYKIFMTLLLEGNDAQAQQMMDQFKFTGDTPALYYAQAAWAFQHKNTDQGNDWIKSARKIYSRALNIVFADTFYDIGWLQRAPETAPATTALAQANAAPAGATPALRFGTDSLPAPQPLTAPAANEGSAGSPAAAPSVAATTEQQQQPVAAATAAAIAASSPVPVLATQAGPAVVAKNLPPVVAQASPTKTAAAKTTAFATAPATSVASSAAMTPAATALAPARIREYSQPSFAELIDRASDPQTLLVGGLLLGGVALLGWLVFQHARRQTPGSSLYESALPLTDPPFGDAGPATRERRITRENLVGGPPKLSLQLKASEPAVRKAVLPSGAPNSRASSPGAGNSGIASPNLASASVSEVRPAAPTPPPPAAKTPPTAAPVDPPNEKKFAPATPKTPLRDEKEVSLAARPKPSFLPTPLPAKAAATQRPEIIAEPKKPAPEPQKIAAVEAKKFMPTPAEPARQPVTAEVKSPVPPAPPAVEKPVIAREEPVGQGQPVPQLTSIAPSAPVIAAAAPTAPAPKTEEKIEQRPARIEPETAAIAAIAGKAQAQPPVQTPTFAAKAITTKPIEPVGPALTAPQSEAPAKPEQAPVRLEPETAALAGLAAAKAPQSSVETPAITSNVTATKPTTPPPKTPVIMPEPTPITAINEPRPAPANGGQPGAPAAAAAQPNAGLQTAVQLTFSLEIASLQLTPNFKMGSLQLKPISKIVSMRLAPSAQPQPAMNLQVTFELSSVQLGAGGSIGTVRLTPSSAQRPTPITSPSFEIAGLQLVSSSATSPVQLTPTQQGAASVLMTASFQIATVEFSPSFESASVVLNSTSKNVAV
ncbi:MAG: tetratricopeptide repeat protein, partial [Chthoniobacterales bacterium]